MRLWYTNRANPALWVLMSGSWRYAYTPNFANPFGPFIAAVFALLVVAVIALMPLSVGLHTR